MAKKKDRAARAEGTSPVEMGDREMLRISRALADPKRFEVFRCIASGDSLSCLEMRTSMALKPATLSHHIKQLEGANLIETVRDGKLVRAGLRRKVWKSYLSYMKQLAG